MSPKPSAEQGLQWLLEQIDRMGELRNGTTRDPGFREWRQNTLTVLQRIWPGQAARAQRFRRVPFAPPSARATEQEARECFERGFAEVRKLLKMWEAELKHVGTEGFDAEAETGEPTPGPLGQIESAPDVPTVALPPRSKPHASPGPRPAPDRQPVSSKARARPKHQLRDMLGFGEWSDDSAGEAAHADSPAEAKPTKRAAAKAAQGTVPGRSAPAAPRRKSSEPARPAPSDALGRSIADAIEHARSGDSPAPGDLAIQPGFAGPMGAASNPLSSVAEQPSAPIAAPAPEAADPEAGREFVALISELERLGVPAGDLTRVGLGLAELGARLAQGSVPWETLQEAMALVMDYPALARRAVPLLLRHFEAAA